MTSCSSRRSRSADAHGDPADRMLVATAIIGGLTLVTADAVLLDWRLRGFRARDATE